MIGREVSRDRDGSHVESQYWIGKPWRRVTLLVNDFYWKGERSERSWDLTVHIGFRRLGFGASWIIFRSLPMDYTEEHQ